jgi:hypothetical protein
VGASRIDHDEYLSYTSRRNPSGGIILGRRGLILGLAGRRQLPPGIVLAAIKIWLWHEDGDVVTTATGSGRMS